MGRGRENLEGHREAPLNLCADEKSMSPTQRTRRDSSTTVSLGSDVICQLKPKILAPISVVPIR